MTTKAGGRAGMVSGFRDWAKMKKDSWTWTTVWLDLEDIFLSERSQSEKNKYHMISLICGI